jgi:hypothetical protein
MSKETNETWLQLISNQNRQLSIKADLIKRGLDLACSLEIRPLKVLVHGDKLLNQSIAEYLKMIYQGRYNITCFIMDLSLASEIVNLAETQTIDVFILILNNIIFKSEERSSENHIENILNFLTLMHKNYGKPIIGLFGWPDDPSFKKKAKDAGADVVLRMPFKLEDFNKAFESCLIPQNEN